MLFSRLKCKKTIIPGAIKTFTIENVLLFNIFNDKTNMALLLTKTLEYTLFYRLNLRLKISSAQL